MTNSVFKTLVPVLFASAASAALAAPGPQEMHREVEAMREADVSWRKIPWHTCLLKGLREAQAEKKPVILWVFIDRPVDDKRC